MAMWPFKGGIERVSVLKSAQETLRLMQEVGRTSTTKGVETMGRLTQKGVEVAQSGVSMIPIGDLPFALARHHQAAVVATMKFERDAAGFGVLALSKEDALRLVDLLLQKGPGTTREIGALEESAVGETANIALNAMVTAVAKRAGVSIKTTAPETSFDAKKKLAEVGKAPQGEDHAIVVETRFTEKGANVKGTMLLVFFTRAPPVTAA